MAHLEQKKLLLCMVEGVAEEQEGATRRGGWAPTAQGVSR